jgi:hypothetical protein
MLMLSLFRCLSSAAAMLPWLLNLTTRLLAHVLNMPEPLVHTTGIYVFVQVQAVEHSIGKALNPARLLRRLVRSRQARRRLPTPPTAQ